MAETPSAQQDRASALAIALDRAATTDDRIDAIDVLCEASLLEDEVVDALIALLSDGDSDVRAQAQSAFEDAPSPRAIEPLIAAIAREKRENARWVYGVEIQRLCEALGACGAGDPTAIDVLAQNLIVSESMYAALGAFDALAKMGPKAEHARSALEAIVRDANPWQRAQAHRALWAQDGDTERHVKALVPILAETKEGGGSAAASAKLALEFIGEPAIAVLEGPEFAKGPHAKRAAKAAEGVRARVARRAARSK